MIHVGHIARRVRESLGLTQQQLAEALGVSNVHVSNIENDKAFPSQNLINRYREEFGVDLNVLAWCLHGDVEKLPPAVRKPAGELARALRQQYAGLLEDCRDLAD
jgi:transcriptional regulator with XRE-family HTH domain